MTDDEMKQEKKLIAADPDIQPPPPEPIAPEVPTQPGQPMQTESLNESVIQDLIDLKESEIKLNDALISYMQS